MLSVSLISKAKLDTLNVVVPCIYDEIDYSFTDAGGRYSTEGAPLPWGTFNGEFTKNYFVGGDCLNMSVYFNVNITPDDYIYIYEKNYQNEWVWTGYINYINEQAPVSIQSFSYQLKYPGSQYPGSIGYGKEGYIIVRVVKQGQDLDIPELYPYGGYNTFIGVYWWCTRL